MTSPVDLAKLRELLAAATPGEWTHDCAGGLGVGDVQHALVGADDAALICALVNAAPELIDAAEAHAESKARREPLEALGNELLAISRDVLAAKDAEIVRLREALKPFADFATFDNGTDDTLSGVLAYMKGKRMVQLTWKHLRQAAAALEQPDGE